MFHHHILFNLGSPKEGLRPLDPLWSFPLEKYDLQEARKFVMPFGKHAGKCLEDLPDDYLDWLYENIQDERIAERARIVYENS